MLIIVDDDSSDTDDDDDVLTSSNSTSALLNVASNKILASELTCRSGPNLLNIYQLGFLNFAAN